jgi:hypothetical protein
MVDNVERPQNEPHAAAGALLDALATARYLERRAVLRAAEGQYGPMALDIIDMTRCIVRAAELSEHITTDLEEEIEERKEQ